MIDYLYNGEERARLLTETLGSKTELEVRIALGKTGQINYPEKAEMRDPIMTAEKAGGVVGLKELFWQQERYSDMALAIVQYLLEVLLEGPYYTPGGRRVGIGTNMLGEI